MAITRIKVWIAGEVLTASDLNNEFNNIINNLSFALSGDIGDGSLTAPGIKFLNDGNTGLYRQGADQVALVAGGATAFVVTRAASPSTAFALFSRGITDSARVYPALTFGGADDGIAAIAGGTLDFIVGGRRAVQASAYTNATNYLVLTPSQSGQPVLIEAAGGDTNVPLLLRGKGTGYVTASNFVLENYAATQSPTITGRAYWQSTEGSVHVSAGTLIARIPAITNLQRGDLIVGSGTVSGATTFGRIRTGTIRQYLGTNGSDPSWSEPIPGTYSVAAYGAVGDYQSVGDAAISNTDNTLTSASNPWVAADVGKTVVVAGAGVGGAPLITTIASFTSAGSVETTAAASTTVTGQIAEWGTNDTAAIQSAIDAASAAFGTIRFDAKAYFHGALDMTDGYIVMEGAGFAYGSTRLYTFANSGNVWDCTGSRVRISKIQLGKADQVTTPDVGLLLAGSATTPGIDFCSFENMFLDGKYAVAGLYVYGVVSSSTYKAAFWNHKSGAGTQVSAFFGNTNPAGITSAFTTINTGTVDCSDWTFTGSEFHKFAGAGANNRGMSLSGVSSFRFLGGNISAGGTYYIEILVACSKLLFSGTTFQDEGDTVTPTAVFLLSAALTDLQFDECDTTSTTTLLAGSGAFTGGKSALYAQGGTTTLGAVDTQIYIGGGFVTADVNTAGWLIPGPCIINSLRALLSSAPGVGKTRVFTAVVNGSNSALTATISGAATTGSDATHYVQLTAGDKVQFGGTGTGTPADTHGGGSIRVLGF